VSGQDTIQLRPRRFDYRLAHGAAAAVVQIRDGWDRILVEEPVKVVEGVLDYRVDLRRTSAGQYSLWVDGGLQLSFYADDQLTGRNVFGVIDIYRDDSVPAACQFTDPAQNHSVLAKNYHLVIDNRKTYWKYYVALKYRLKGQTPAEWPDDWPAKWEIIYAADPNVHIEPDAGNIKTLTDGTLAVPFIADTALPLQEAPIKSVQLKKTGPGNNVSGIREVDHLPNPSVKTLLPDPSDDKIYSEVFVYV
jgi:hypothetical protein